MDLCRNCHHQIICMIDNKEPIGKLFNGHWVHANVGNKFKSEGRSWAHICRVRRCGCMAPEPLEVNQA